jgi:excisionase family DNA binding protein
MEALLLKPEEVAECLNVGRSKIYEPLRSGALESIRTGTRRRVPRTAMDAYIEHLREPIVASGRAGHGRDAERSVGHKPVIVAHPGPRANEERPGREPQYGADLGFYRSRLSESNRRPSHYEAHPPCPSRSGQVRSGRSGPLHWALWSGRVRTRTPVWLTDWLTPAADAAP